LGWVHDSHWGVGLPITLPGDTMLIFQVEGRDMPDTQDMSATIFHILQRTRPEVYTIGRTLITPLHIELDVRKPTMYIVHSFWKHAAECLCIWKSAALTYLTMSVTNTYHACGQVAPPPSTSPAHESQYCVRLSIPAAYHIKSRC
jgi:hypothetical protein